MVGVSLLYPSYMYLCVHACTNKNVHIIQ